MKFYVKSKIFLAILGGILHFIILPLPLYFFPNLSFSHVDYGIIFGYLVLITLFSVVETYSSFLVTESISMQRVRSILPYLTGIMLFIFFELLLVDYVYRRNTSVSAMCVGTFILMCGVYLRHHSIKSLRRYFTSHIEVVQSHELIQTGIYRYLRHPSELGLLMIALGISLYMSSLVALLYFSLVIVPITIKRIESEDALLKSVFGQNFIEYKQKTASLFPKYDSLKKMI